jgi:hypothetical protein
MLTLKLRRAEQRPESRVINSQLQAIPCRADRAEERLMHPHWVSHLGEPHLNSLHKEAFEKEMAWGRYLIGERSYAEAFVHLERAHVLGQAHITLHVVSHWHMLRVAVQRREPKAALGQLVRIVLGAIGSAVGSVPTGNTGGTDISMFKRLPVDPELLGIMQGEVPDISLNADRLNLP